MKDSNLLDLHRSFSSWTFSSSMNGP